MSRAARLTLSATAWIALGAAAFFLITTEQQIADRHSALRMFDLRARETAGALGDARGAQQAYVAAGQSSSYWIPKVATIIEEVGKTIDALQATAVSASAARALVDASAAVNEFGNVDKRVRDYLNADESLMASDVVFSEGSAAASRALLQVETARIAEHQAFDADEATLRRLEAYAIGGAAGLSGLILAILGLARGARQAAGAPSGDAESAATHADDQLLLRQSSASLGRMTPNSPPPQAAAAKTSPLVTAESPIALKAAAELCTDFGRIHDLAELKMLLGRAARVINANGLVVWLGSPAGIDLQPVLAHGYSDQVLSLMRPVPRTADNAAAAAYRSGSLQVVASRPGGPLGAVVAPLLAADGCIGALTAEVKDGAEQAEQVHALASIFAAQLAGILAASATDGSGSEARTVAR
jgi:hypothetical protein